MSLRAIVLQFKPSLTKNIGLFWPWKPVSHSKKTASHLWLHCCRYTHVFESRVCKVLYFFHNTSPKSLEISFDIDNSELICRMVTDKRCQALFLIEINVGGCDHRKPTTHRIWTCAKPDSRLYWIKLCSSNSNHYITAPDKEF